MTDEQQAVARFDITTSFDPDGDTVAVMVASMTGRVVLFDAYERLRRGSAEAVLALHQALNTALEEKSALRANLDAVKADLKQCQEDGAALAESAEDLLRLFRAHKKKSAEDEIARRHMEWFREGKGR